MALTLFLASLMLFITAEASSVLAIAIPEKTFYLLGSFSLLAAFALLFGFLMLNTIDQIARGVSRYFSGIERRQRRLWFIQGKLEQEHSLFFHRRRKTRYIFEAQKQRLTRANNRKHSRMLAKAIDNDLAAVKPHVSADQFKSWRQKNHVYSRQVNIEGLIALQQTIIKHLSP